MPENPFGFIPYTPSTQDLSVYNTMLYDPNMQGLSAQIPMSHDPYTQGLSAYTQIPAHDPNPQSLPVHHNAIPAHDSNPQGLPVYHNTRSMQQPWWPASGHNEVATMPDIPMTLPPSDPQTAVHQNQTWHA
jgi:hypothetical protein